MMSFEFSVLLLDGSYDFVDVECPSLSSAWKWIKWKYPVCQTIELMSVSVAIDGFRIDF